jgi:arsenite methyltransferase
LKEQKLFDYRINNCGGGAGDKMSEPKESWARWLTIERFAGNETVARTWLAQLERIRDRVLRSARLKNGEAFLDVGCGDGLLGFGALSQVAPNGRVIFSDQSSELVEICRRVATESGFAERCEFVSCDARTLDSIADSSIDAIGTRSVLMYLPDRAQALRTFYRVLKKGGRISLFEPINRFGFAGYPDLDRGTDFSSVSDLRERIVQHYNRVYPNDPTVNFDAADLFDAAEAAGFATIQVRAELTGSGAPPRNWDAIVRTPPYAGLPPLAEVLATFAPEDRERYERNIRPLVEKGGSGRFRMAAAYVTAIK